jgi:hypothetical protein
MGTVSSLVTSIKTRAASVLGGTYSEIAYVNDIKKNSFKGNEKRYGVIAKDGDQIDGVNRHITIEQTFEVVLTDNFMNTSMSDSAQQVTNATLQDLCVDIYKDLASTKCGANPNVLIVTDLSLNEPETLDSIVVQRCSFNIKYRTAL